MKYLEMAYRIMCLTSTVSYKKLGITVSIIEISLENRFNMIPENM